MTVKGYRNIGLSENYILEFLKPTEIYFPDDCIICSKKAGDKISKNIYGRFLPTQDYKNEYKLELPVCSECKSKVEMKTGLQSKSGKILCFSLILGLIVSIVLITVFHSLIFGLSILFIFILLPYLAHRTRMKSKLKVEKYLGIKLEEGNPDTLKFTFTNMEYAKELERVNQLILEEKAKIQEQKSIENEPTQNVLTMDSAMQEKITCPYCMALVNSHLKFCTNCGRNIKPNEF